MIYFVSRRVRCLVLLLLLQLLSACGGGSSGSASLPATVSPAVDQSQGGFQGISRGVMNRQAAIQHTINTTLEGQDFQAVYAVTAYKLEYITLNAQNERVKVSGLIAVPVKDSPSPVLSYQHATTFKNRAAPSFHLSAGERSIEIALASQGYIVVAADYIGYGSSFGAQHPYLQKQPSADVVVDMLKAAQAWLDANQIARNGQLFITGYSQGGYVSMAAMQALQDKPLPGLQVSAAVLGGGPYDLETALDELLGGIRVPGDLQGIAIDLLERVLVPADAEVEFERTFLERFFAGDTRDNVHRWRPDYPVKLLHGREDEIVPVESAYSTERTMRDLGADIELTLCDANPARHLNCVLPYLRMMLGYFQQVRTD